jgi:hypothetical protein
MMAPLFSRAIIAVPFFFFFFFCLIHTTCTDVWHPSVSPEYSEEAFGSAGLVAGGE